MLFSYGPLKTCVNQKCSPLVAEVTIKLSEGASQTLTKLRSVHPLYFRKTVDTSPVL